MSERKRRSPTSGEDPGPERIKDPKAGLERTKAALRKILKVPKEALMGDGEKKGRGRA